MKPTLFPLSRGLGAAVLLAASVISLPMTSQAQRGGDDSRRERSPSPGRTAQPRPSTPAQRPSVPQQRPPTVSRPTTPQPRPPTITRPTPQQPPSVTRPSSAYNKAYPGRSPQRPPVVSRPTPERPPVVTRPSPGRPPEVTRPSPSRPPVVTRPSPSRPPVVTRPSPSRPPVVTRPSVRPTTPYEKAYPGRRPGGVTTAHRGHLHFHDSSRFATIDRHISYRSYPRHHYRLCHGNGYRGLGWYFGPPNVSYYYETPGVYYYSSRNVAPASYVNLSYSPVNTLDYAVQQALAELGYYDGPVDGDIGPMSRLAIANFQADNGLEPTGIIDETLVSYLQIE